MRDKLVNSLVYGILFLLPWQTRWIFGSELIVGEVWEYGVLSFYLVEALLVLAVVLRPRLKASKNADWPLIFGGFFLWVALISVYHAGNAHLAIMAWLHLLAAFFLFRTLLDSRLKPKYLVLAFVLGLLGPSLLGICQTLTGTSPAFTYLGLAAHDAATLGASVVESLDGRLLRAYGSFGHPNIFGGYLAVAFVGLMMLPRWFGKKYQKIGWHSLAVVMAVAFVFTFSRSAWLAFFVGAMIGGWILLWEHRVAARQVLPMILVSLIAIVLSVIVFWQPVEARFNPNLRLESISITERTTGYSLYSPTVGGKWLFGVGVGNYTVELAKDFPGSPAWSFQPIHNAILLVLAEVGVLGLVFMVLWAAAVDRINYRALPRAGAVGALIMGAEVLVIAFFDHYLFSLWAGLALMAVVFAFTLRLSK